MIVYTIEDQLQKMVDLKDLYFPELSILLIFGYIYLYTDTDHTYLFSQLGKYLILFIVIRYILSSIVQIKEYNEEGKLSKNHQSLSIYLFLIIFGSMYLYTNGIMPLQFTLVSIMLSGLMMVLSGRMWTTDALLTIAVSLLMLQWKECYSVITTIN